jgi:hypothetical protein
MAVVPLAFVWLLATVVPVLAAEPPADVVLDGIVTVTFAQPTCVRPSLCCRFSRLDRHRV